MKEKLNFILQSPVYRCTFSWKQMLFIYQNTVSKSFFMNGDSMCFHFKIFFGLAGCGDPLPSPFAFHLTKSSISYRVIPSSVNFTKFVLLKHKNSNGLFR